MSNRKGVCVRLRGGMRVCVSVSVFQSVSEFSGSTNVSVCKLSVIKALGHRSCTSDDENSLNCIIENEC